MKVFTCELDGVVLIEPTKYEDERGYFFESFNKKKFLELTGISVDFVQDNQSKSQNGVVRGLHLQLPPHSQDKLVRVIRGAILDVVVDLRVDSATFGKHYMVELSSSNLKQLFVPKGFAHGFRTLEEDTTIVYKCSDYYSPQDEACLKWDDKDLNIDWGIENPIVSDKDKNGGSFADFESPFRILTNSTL